MPHKSQLLLQLAHAAAKETRQQGVLPSVAVNVWDTLTGSNNASLCHSSVAAPAAAQPRIPAEATASSADNRLPPGLNFLQFTPTAEHPGDGNQAQMLAHQTTPLHQWGGLAGQTSHLTGDIAVFRDRPSWSLPRSQLPAPLLHASALARLPAASSNGRPTPMGTRDCSSSSSTCLQQFVGSRKSRFNNSISLNKLIMKSHNARELHTIVRSKGPMFDFFNISSAIARVPKLVGACGCVQSDPTSKALVDDLAQLMASHIHTFDARGLANSAWAFGKLKYAPNQKLPALIAAAAIHKLDGFSAQNLSNLLWSFVYLHHRNEALLQAVSKQVVAKIDEFKPQELANVVWALASMDHYDAQLMQAVGARATTMLDAFKEQELSNIVWACAKLRHSDPELLQRLLQAVDHKLPHFLPQGVSNVAWAMATAAHCDDVLLKKLLDHCLADICSYDVQGLSNMLWACATLGYRDTDFLAAATHECSLRVERMSSQNLSNVLWACATLGYSDSRLLSTWAEAVMHKLDLFEPQGLSNSAWAFAKLGFSSPVLFEALAEAASSRLDAFTPQGLSNTAWAYATAGHYHPGLMHQLTHQATQQAQHFSAINCSNTLWAFASLRHYNADLFDALLERLAHQLDDVEPQHVANCLLALARVNHTLGDTTDALRSSAQRLMPLMNQQELCNTVWAMGVLGLLDIPAWEVFCDCLANIQGLTPEGVHQAFHAQLMLHSHIAQALGTSVSNLPAEQLPRLPAALASHAKDLWLASAVDVTVSKLQADVSSALEAAGIPNSMEWLTDDGLFSIDIAFEVDGQQVAVEVDGSHHYTNSLPPRPLSEVAVRRRMLQDRGWRVVNLGYMEWEALPGDSSGRAAALLRLLSAELGPVDTWKHVGHPSRAPGSRVASLADSQAAEQQQQQQQQSASVLQNWNADSVLSGGAFASTFQADTPAPGLMAGLQGGYTGRVAADGAAALVAAGLLGLPLGAQDTWNALRSTAPPGGQTGWAAGADSSAGLGVLNVPAGVSMWGSDAAVTSGAAVGPSSSSLYQQLTALQMQLLQQTLDAPHRPGVSAAAAAGCPLQVGPAVGRYYTDNSAESAPLSPGKLYHTAGAWHSSLASRQLQAALATAQQQWRNSPDSGKGSGASSCSSSKNITRKAAAFMWGDPTAANIWAP